MGISNQLTDNSRLADLTSLLPLTVTQNLLIFIFLSRHYFCESDTFNIAYELKIILGSSVGLRTQ